MFNKLQAKWKVTGSQLALIIATFACGGSLTGWVARKLLQLADLGIPWLYTVLYILLATLLWPLAVLVVSIPFGQFTFFKKYIKRIIGRMSGKTHAEVISGESTSNLKSRPDLRKPPVKLAIFASGAGSNAQEIIRYFQQNERVKVALIVCNKPGAGVIGIAKTAGIDCVIIEKDIFFKGDAYLGTLRMHEIDFIVLAGFLWKIPPVLIGAYPKRIINIHPALLPAYGGKGMYGIRVHEAVIASGERESGITIHMVDEQYDHGSTLFQARCPVVTGESPEMLAARVHALEHAHFPRVIEEYLKKEFGSPA